MLDALRKPSDSNMFNFGVRAIRQFKSELPGWPQYCQHVLEIPQVREADPGLIQFIDAALREQGLRRGESQTQESPMLRGSGEASVCDPNGIIDDTHIDNGVGEDSRVRDTESTSDQLPASHSQGSEIPHSMQRSCWAFVLGCSDCCIFLHFAVRLFVLLALSHASVVSSVEHMMFARMHNVPVCMICTRHDENFMW